MKFHAKFLTIISLYIGIYTCVVQSQNLSMSIFKTDNSEQKIALTGLNKLIFSGSNIVINYKSGTYENIALSNIKKIYFATISGINNPNFTKETIVLYPNPAAKFIAFKNISKNEYVSIFTFNGIELFKTIVNSTSSTIDISTLQKGIYLVKIDNIALKFTKL